MSATSEQLLRQILDELRAINRKLDQLDQSVQRVESAVFETS